MPEPKIRTQSPGEVWHSEYHQHRVRDADDLQAQHRYMANNPAREDYPHLHTALRCPSRIDQFPFE